MAAATVAVAAAVAVGGAGAADPSRPAGAYVEIVDPVRYAERPDGRSVADAGMEVVCNADAPCGGSQLFRATIPQNQRTRAPRRIVFLGRDGFSVAPGARRRVEFQFDRRRTRLVQRLAGRPAIIFVRTRMPDGQVIETKRPVVLEVPAK